MHMIVVPGKTLAQTLANQHLVVEKDPGNQVVILQHNELRAHGVPIVGPIGIRVRDTSRTNARRRIFQGLFAQ
jgi:hypothetical protein